MKTFNEVLKKHFGENEERINSRHIYYCFDYFARDSIVAIYVKYENGSDYFFAEFATFKSPEKLDQFLTLLFGEEP